nr:TIGR02996 domain-containing protein [Kofleriaceae bacterium]
MTTLAALGDAIRAEPAADEPRLVYADACAASDPERGELIALQCAIAAGSLARDAAIAARRRAGELADAHGARWAGLDGLVERFELRRGFVETVAIDAEVFAARGDELFERAPALRRVELTGFVRAVDDDRDVPAAREELVLRAVHAADAPAMRRVRVLALGAVHAAVRGPSGTTVPRRDAGTFASVLERFAAAGALATLDGLALAEPPMLLGAFAQARQVAALAELELDQVNAASLPGLARWFAPRRLSVRAAWQIEWAQLAALARDATELAWLGDPAAMPVDARARLRRLGVDWSDAARDALASDPAFGGLAELAVVAREDLARVDGDTLRPLAYAAHLQPRVLALDVPLSSDAIDAIAASPLARRLEVIDLRGRFSRSNRRTTDGAFAGIVLR